MAETQAEQSGAGAWTAERLALVRSLCPKDIPETEFALFAEQCKRSGLDPMLREAFCVARRQNTGNRERPVWVTKYEFQPSETGMLARAERFPDYRGLQASAVFAEDEIIIDAGAGQVVHRFNPAKRKGSLVGAWARVERAGKLPIVVWLDFGGYVQQTPLWAKIPTTMIEKCARVAALRKAYPEAFGGLYVREEMPAEEFSQPSDAELGGQAGERGPKPDAAPVFPTLAPAPRPAPTREELTKAFQTEPVTRPAEEAASPRGDMAGVQVESAAREASPRSKPSVVVVAFGPYKGKVGAELSDMELGETISLAEEKLVEQPKARWAKAMQENLAALVAELELRKAADARRATVAPAAPEEGGREPGMDDGDEAPAA